MINQSDPVQQDSCQEARKRLDDLEQAIHKKAYTKFRCKPFKKGTYWQGAKVIIRLPNSEPPKIFWKDAVKKELKAQKMKLRQLALRTNIPRSEIGAVIEEGFGDSGIDKVLGIKEKYGDRIARRTIFPEPRIIETPYAKELAWIFFKLRDIFLFESDLIHGQNKRDFFGRLANALARASGLPNAANETVVYKGGAEEGLTVILNEAFLILKELKKGNFEYQVFGVSGMIPDDWKDVSE
ncbi:hypothetical protein QUF80_13290 [Desulfococcaceae bacterium HSG8]|nr:hypothetical protein [Desulfococcaceae bacterium HSG8]